MNATGKGDTFVIVIENHGDDDIQGNIVVGAFADEQVAIDHMENSLQIQGILEDGGEECYVTEANGRTVTHTIVSDDGKEA